MLCVSWFGIALNNVRSRRRDASLNDGSGEKIVKCAASIAPAPNDHSFSSVFDASQFTPMNSASYVEPLTNSCGSSSGRLRTAVVGPRTVSREYDEQLASVYPSDVMNRMTRSLYDNGDYMYNHSTTKRDRCNPANRNSVQELDGGSLYQLSTSSPEECTTLSNIEMYDSRQGRPCELHLPSTDSVNNENSAVVVKSPVTPNGRLPLGNYQYTAIDKRALMPNSASKKVMVAPQPHFRSHNTDMCENAFRPNGDMQITHRRRIGPTTTTATTSAYSVQFDNRHNYPREVSVAVVPMSDPRSYDDRGVRARSGGDVRVSALEKRIREIEAVITNNNGQLPSSPSSSSTSFIVPVNPKGPQLVVSSVSSATTQQLMAQEIADKEVEIERLQSQLRQCYSRMELRKIRFDEEVDKFRKESQDAKSQLEKVKSRLGELEVECSEYRERATYVEAARNSAISDSLEKISTQEKELSRLRGEVEQLSGLSAELEKVKNDLKKCELSNSELKGVVEAKEKVIRDLEDSIFAMKMEASCKISSGSLTPCEDARSLNEVVMPRYFAGVKELKDLTPRITTSKRNSTSSCPLRLKKSQSTQQLSPTNDKFSLPSSLSALIRKQTASVMECRLLAKCLKDTALKAINGDLPSVSHLLGCRTESMSESEMESYPTDLSPMTLSSAERHIKKTAEDMQRIERDLNSLREKFVEYYEKKVVEDLQENDMCKLQ